MDLSQLANLGEFVGGIAVLVTLIYLAVQMRGSAVAERSLGHRSFIENFNESFFGPTKDPVIANLLRRAAADFDGLSGDEQMVAASVWGSTMTLCQEGYFLRQSGGIDDELATRIDGFIVSMLQVPGMAAWWQVGGQVYIPTFRAHVERLLASPDGPPPLDRLWSWFSDTPSSSEA